MAIPTERRGSSGLWSRTRTTTRRTLTRTCTRPRSTRTKTSSTPFLLLLQTTKMNVSMTWSWHLSFPSLQFLRKFHFIHCPRQKFAWALNKEKMRYFSLQITKLHFVLTNNFDFTKSQCLLRKVAFLSLHQFSSFKNPVRNHTGKFRRSVCREEHDRGNLRGWTPWLRDSPQGKLDSTWTAPCSYFS